MKERLDKILVERGLFSTREKARGAILAGLVSVEGRTVDKAGTRIAGEAKVEIKEEASPYVSRGGLKLEKALREFGIAVKDKVALDIGASTGGFSDCLLQKGARKVYAVDVGYGQLDWRLRHNKRVINLERKNARYLKRGEIEDEPDLATLDVSFISLDKIIPAVTPLLSREGDIIALIKPQFEVGKGQVGKGGVVREASLHQETILKIMRLAVKLGLGVQGLIASPLRGPAGNREFFLHLSKNKRGLKIEETEGLIVKVVSQSTRAPVGILLRRAGMGKVIIDEERCKGCQLCVEVCPKHLLGTAESTNNFGYQPVRVVGREECSGCALCAAICPDFAIEVYKGLLKDSTDPDYLD